MGSWIWIKFATPRRRGPVVSLEGDEAKVAFRYERLVGWCIACGRIGHECKECRVASEVEKREKSYGEWLKSYGYNAGFCSYSSMSTQTPQV